MHKIWIVSLERWVKLGLRIKMGYKYMSKYRCTKQNIFRPYFAGFSFSKCHVIWILVEGFWVHMFILGDKMN